MRARVVIAILLFGIGFVWVGQGIGLIGGSFMTGEAVWAVIGGLAIAIGLALLHGVQRDRRRNADDDQ